MAVNFFLRTFGIYSLVLVLIGTFGNLFTIYICARNRLRSYTTFIFIGFICFCDTLSLYEWCLDHFTESFFNYIFEQKTSITCRIGFFFQLFSLQSSSWLLVALTLDRYLGSKLKTWRSLYFKSNQAFICSISIISLVFIINSQILFIAGENKNFSIFNCYFDQVHEDWIDKWRKIHTLIYSILPFISLAIINSLLFYRTWKRSVSVSDSEYKSNRTKKKKFGLVILILTVGFMITTLPFAIITGFYYKTFNPRYDKKIYIYVCDSIGFTYHGAKFLVLYLSNKKFRKELSIYAEEVLTKYHCLQRRIYSVNSKSITESSKNSI